MRLVFVSYRRTDSSDITGRICDHLADRFGEDQLFKDVEAIRGGQDFRKVISKSIAQCKVLIAVIGTDWLEVDDTTGRRRIDDPDDWVRIEITSALKRGIPVIPVLVQGASMPAESDLPDELSDLAFLNALPVRQDHDFHHDIDRLATELARNAEGLTGAIAITRKVLNQRTLVWSAAVSVVLASLAFVAVINSPTESVTDSEFDVMEEWVIRTHSFPDKESAKAFKKEFLDEYRAIKHSTFGREFTWENDTLLVRDPDESGRYLVVVDTFFGRQNEDNVNSELAKIRQRASEVVAANPLGRMLDRAIAYDYSARQWQCTYGNIDTKVFAPPQEQDDKERFNKKIRRIESSRCYKRRWVTSATLLGAFLVCCCLFMCRRYVRKGQITPVD